MPQFSYYDPATALLGNEIVLIEQGGKTVRTNPNAFETFLSYTLPVAGSSTLGGVKSGTDISVDGLGNVSIVNDSHTHIWGNITSTPTTIAGYGITDAAPSIHAHAWGDISAKPTTLSGYGITDAAPLSHVGGDIHIDWTVTGGEVIHADRYTNTTDHTALSNIGINTHAQIDTHLALVSEHIDWTITGGEVIHADRYTNTTDHNALSNIGSNTHIQIDTHIADSTIHFTKESIAITHLSDVINTFSGLTDGQVLTYDSVNGWQNETPAPGVTDHNLLSNIGTNTHAQIDGHLALTAEHIDWAVTGGEVIHADRYTDTVYTLPVADTGILGGVKDGTDISIDATGNVSIVNDSHTHIWGNITSTPTTIAGYGITDAAPLSHTADSTIHFTKESIALTHLSDVISTFSGLTDGQVLTYDSVNGWQNETPSIGVSDHLLLSNIGTNTHTQIDTHLALVNEHIDWTFASDSINTSGGGSFGLGLSADSITERTATVGVTIEGVLLKDNNVNTTGSVTGANLNISNWDTAFGWGDHAGLYAPVGHDHSDGNIYAANSTLTTDYLFYMGALTATVPFLSFDAGDYFQYDRTNNLFSVIIGGVNQWSLSASTADFQNNAITTSGNITGGNLNISNWDSAFSWGNWASNFGTAAGTICQGNDSRLSDARTPTSHAYSSHSGTVPSSAIPTFPNAFGNTTGNIHFFVNDGGGNLGMRWNSSTGASNTLIEPGQAFELEIANDTVGGDWTLKYGTTAGGLAGEAITWANAIAVDGASGNITLKVVTATDFIGSGDQLTDVDAVTLNGASESVTAGNNTIVKRHSSGYIYANYFNGSSSFSTSGANSGMGNFIGNNGSDTFARSYSPAGARSALGLIVEKDLSLENPTASEDMSWFYTNRAITIQELVFVLVGSGSVTPVIRHSTNRSLTGTSIRSSNTAITNTTTGTIETSFSDATIPANSFVWVETTAQSGTVNVLGIHMDASID
jgi:hypothetical protein